MKTKKSQTKPKTNENDNGNGNTESNGNRPEKVRVGVISGSIWRNELTNRQGETFVRHNVTFTRGYRSNGQWFDTGSFGRDDLLTLALVVNMAHSRIHELEREEKENASGQSEAG